MPITKSAKKALRQTAKKRVRNLQRKNTLKTLVKHGRKFVEQKNWQEAQKLLPQVYKALDKAAQRHVIAKNTAARKKSHLTKLFQTKPTAGR